MKSIKELIIYFYKNGSISKEELDYLKEEGYVKSSDLKGISVELRKKKKRKTVQPAEPDDADWTSGGGGGGSKKKVNLASLIYDINKYAEEHMERWEKDLASLYHIAEIFLPEKKFSDLKSVSESLLKEIRSQPLEYSVNKLVKAFKADDELSEKFEFIVHYRKHLQGLDKAEFREIKERMLSEKGMRLPSKFIPIGRRQGYLTLASMLRLQSELRRIDKALQAESKLEKDFSGKKFRFHFTKNGEISSLEILKEVNVFNITLSRGDEIIPTDGGEFELHLKDSSFYRSETGNTRFRISLLNGTEELTTFLLQDTEINGILYLEKSSISFHPDGTVSRGTLAKETEINGITYSERYGISLYPGGTIYGGTLAKDTELNGIEYSKEEYITFERNGNVGVGTLTREAEINGITYSKGTRIGFHSDGTVMGGVLAKDTAINGILYREESYISFDPDGTVPSGTLAKDTAINGILYREESYISFHPNGTVSRGTLAKDTAINGIVYQSGDISFHSDGTVMENLWA